MHAPLMASRQPTPEGLAFGQRIARLRDRADLKQADVAAELGCHVTTISAWECGRNEPSALQAVRLANVLRVTVATLLGVRDSEPDLVRREAPVYVVDLDALRRTLATTTWAAWNAARASVMVEILPTDVVVTAEQFADYERQIADHGSALRKPRSRRPTP